MTSSYTIYSHLPCSAFDLAALVLLVAANQAAVFYAGYCAGKARGKTPITPPKEQRPCPS